MFSLLPLVLRGSIDKRGIGGVHDLGKGVAVERKAAARRRGSQADRGLWNGLASLLRRSAARQQRERRRKRYKRGSCSASATLVTKSSRKARL